MAGRNWGELYFDHLHRYFGDPVYSYQFERNDSSPSIQMLVYDGVFKGCATFCSLGLTHYSQEVQEVVEVISSADFHGPKALEPYFDRIPEVLAKCLFFLVQSQLHIHPGFAIGGLEKIDRDFVAETNKSALYFTVPFDLPVAFRSISNAELGVKGYIRSAIFLSRSEYDFYLQHGRDRFETLMEESNVEPYNLERPTCI